MTERAKNWHLVQTMIWLPEARMHARPNPQTARGQQRQQLRNTPAALPQQVREDWAVTSTLCWQDSHPIS
jgi:hypothetical protein